MALAFIALCFGVLIASQLTADRDSAAPSIDKIEGEVESVIAQLNYRRAGDIKTVDKIDLKLVSVELVAPGGSGRVRSSYPDALEANGWINDGHTGSGDLREDHYCKGLLRLTLVPIADANAATHTLYVAWTRIKSSRFYCRVS